MPVYSFPYRQRAFFACFPAPCWFLFLSFSYSSRGVRTLFLPSGSSRSSFFSFSRINLLSFSRRFLVVFSPLWSRYPPFSRFPVRFPHSLRSSLCSSPFVRGVPWGCALSLFACSRLVSRFVISCRRAGRRCLFRRVWVCPVAECCGDGLVPCRFAWRVVPCRCVGRGVLLGFDCSICGVPSSYFLLRRAMVLAARAAEANRAAAAPACSTPVWTSCGVSAGAGAGVLVACIVGCGAVLICVIASL